MKPLRKKIINTGAIRKQINSSLCRSSIPIIFSALTRCVLLITLFPKEKSYFSIFFVSFVEI